LFSVASKCGSIKNPRYVRILAMLASHIDRASKQISLLNP